MISMMFDHSLRFVGLAIGVDGNDGMVLSLDIGGSPIASWIIASHLIITLYKSIWLRS